MLILTTLLLLQQPLKHQPQPTVPAITAGDLMTRLYIFADDSMQGREAGTLAHIKGTDYIAAELQRIGAQPGGDKGTFYQDFGLEEVAPNTAVSVSGEALEAGRDFITFPFVGLPELGAPWSAENVNVIFGGQIGSSRMVGPDAVDGKIVLFLPANGPDGWQFWPKFPPPQYQRYARAKGIVVAALDNMPDQIKGFLGASQFRIAGTGETKQGTIPLLYVTKSVAEKMMGGPVTGILPGAEGKPMTAKGWFVPRATPAPGRNVVAIIPGTDPAAQAAVRRLRCALRSRRAASAGGGSRFAPRLQRHRAPPGRGGRREAGPPGAEGQRHDALGDAQEGARRRGRTRS